MSLTFNEEINEALDYLLEKNNDLFLLGLGITDPKAFFGTTTHLLNKYGPSRLLECPTSENAYLGHALGLALGGKKTIVHYQRMDFMLYAYDQIINNLAKWNDMFGKNHPLPVVIRTLIGMGWGQGAQHSQNLTSHFLQVPNLNVIAPSCPASANILLKQSLDLNKPVIFVEHRWLQYLKQSPEKKPTQIQIGKALKRSNGNKLTIVTWSYSTVEALRFLQYFPEIDAEVIDLLTLSQIDLETLAESVLRTKRLLFWEPAIENATLAPQLITLLLEHGLKFEFARIALPFANAASAPQQNLNYYWSLRKIINLFNNRFGYQLQAKESMRWPIDVDLQNWSPWL